MVNKNTINVWKCPPLLPPKSRSSVIVRTWESFIYDRPGRLGLRCKNRLPVDVHTLVDLNYIYKYAFMLAWVAGGIRVRASGSGAAIFLAGEARKGFRERRSREWKFNSTLHQSSHGFATRVHGFATKTKALAREIPSATQAKRKSPAVRV